ncbi:MAG: methylase [Coxiella sp. (in: Bacteria)]|nr:MAG: methylase [Coxiella sp. (in: g-proteobacteria)]
MYFSEAAERNKKPIFLELRSLLKAEDHILEIGSGTGQHACYFTEQDQSLVWQCSDISDNMPSLTKHINDQESNQLLPPICLNVSAYLFAQQKYDVVYSANALHIMSWDNAQLFLNNVAQALKTDGALVLYGPYAYNDQPLCESNMTFDNFLRARDSQSGIRNFNEVNTILQSHGFVLEIDVAMPANNRLLIWKLM